LYQILDTKLHESGGVVRTLAAFFTVQAGVLTANGHKLQMPTVRSLAADLGVAVGTVARAYKELEAAGVVEARRRGGTIVAGVAAGAGDTARAPVPEEVTAAVDRYIAAGRKAQLSDEVLLDLLRCRLRRS
jgi:DNA-binding transcriptional regulator YhcF (GntR family)